MAMLTLSPPAPAEAGSSAAAPLRGLPEHASLAERGKALALYLAQTEVHTYAFSVAANVILSLFPFIVLMLTLARQVFHSPAMAALIAAIVMLLISSAGVFIPLEVALNQVWGARRNRSYLMNQLVSLGLAFAIG